MGGSIIVLVTQCRLWTGNYKNETLSIILIQINLSHKVFQHHSLMMLILLSSILNAAYNYTGNVSLQRTCTYVRTTGSENVYIRDHVVYTTPARFEVGISSRGNWSEISPMNTETTPTTTMTGRFVIGNEVVNVKVHSVNPFTYKRNTPNDNGVIYTYTLRSSNFHTKSKWNNNITPSDLSSILIPKLNNFLKSML